MIYGGFCPHPIYLVQLRICTMFNENLLKSKQNTQGHNAPLPMPENAQKSQSNIVLKSPLKLKRHNFHFHITFAKLNFNHLPFYAFHLVPKMKMSHLYNYIGSGDKETFLLSFHVCMVSSGVVNTLLHCNKIICKFTEKVLATKLPALSVISFNPSFCKI